MDEDEDAVSCDPTKEDQQYKKEAYEVQPCNIRIEELAKPKKIKIQSIYCGYRKILPDRNRKAVMSIIEEEFAKSPEEIENNFHSVLTKNRERHCRKLCQKEARIKHFGKLNNKKRRSMIRLLKDVLKKYMTKAYFNPKHIIMTNRLRRLSNIVLKALCSIRGIPVPKRENTNIRALLMFAVSDFFAFCIDTVYYELQYNKIRDYDSIKAEKDKAKGKPKKKKINT